MIRVILRSRRLGAGLLSAVAVAAPFAATLAAATFVLPSAASAQTVETPKPQKPQKKPGDAAAKAPDRSAAEQAYAAGVRAFDAGKLPEAVTSLSNALMSGGLPNPQMARALYLRGQAYRKQGQAALAYTDLTSALWLRMGSPSPTSRRQRPSVRPPIAKRVSDLRRRPCPAQTPSPRLRSPPSRPQWLRSRASMWLRRPRARRCSAASIRSI